MPQTPAKWPSLDSCPHLQTLTYRLSEARKLGVGGGGGRPPRSGGPDSAWPSRSWVVPVPPEQGAWGASGPGGHSLSFLRMSGNLVSIRPL